MFLFYKPPAHDSAICNHKQFLEFLRHAVQSGNGRAYLSELGGLLATPENQQLKEYQRRHDKVLSNFLASLQEVNMDADENGMYITLKSDQNRGKLCCGS